MRNMAEDKQKKTAVSRTKAEAVKKDDVKPGFFKRIGRWFHDMKVELKKVSWPSRKDVTNNTVVTVVMTLLTAVVLWGFDELAQLVVRALLTLAG
jgi:preprotein translocase subunit SecE